MPQHTLRIVFFGTPDFATHILDTLVAEGHNVVATVTMPDKPAGRGHKLQPSSVKISARQHGIPLLQPESLRDTAFLDELRALCADVFVVVAFRMLPREVWAMPPHGTFNLHASLLPLYRGAAPIQYAILNGETESGVTTFLLDEEIDTGRIILQDTLPLSSNETGGSLHDRLMTLGAGTVLRTLALMESGEPLPTVAQEWPSDQPLPKASKIYKADRRVSCVEMTATEIDRRVRAMSPYPTAWMEWQMASGEVIEVKLYEVAITLSSPSLLPGQAKVEGTRLYVGTQQGAIELLSLQLPSKRRVGGADFLRGFDLSALSTVL